MPRTWFDISFKPVTNPAPEGEPMNDSTDLAVRPDPIPATPPAVGLFGTDNPKLVIERATNCAKILKDVIVKQHLAKKIGSSEYILVEGWTTLGALVGVFPKVEWTRPLHDGDEQIGWEAAVVVVNTQGVEIGRAEAQCLRSERNWKSRDDFALRSMAQTRAMGKALRMPLGFIAVLAGYEATPAEEMPEDLPFDSGPAQDPTIAAGDEAHGASGTGGAGQSATNREVDDVLEVARELGVPAEEELLRLLANERAAHQGKVRWPWLDDQRTDLVARVEEQRQRLPEEAGPAAPSGGGQEHRAEVPPSPTGVSGGAGELADRLIELARKLRAVKQTRLAIEANRQAHLDDPEKHVEWLRTQVAAAEKKADA